MTTGHLLSWLGGTAWIVAAIAAAVAFSRAGALIARGERAPVRVEAPA